MSGSSTPPSLRGNADRPTSMTSADKTVLVIGVGVFLRFALPRALRR